MKQDKILNKEAIVADEKLEAAIKKKSFSLPYGGGEIWSEHLDGLYANKDIVMKKFRADMQEMLRPSAPGAIAVAIAQTRVDKEILDTIIQTFRDTDKKINKVAFVGLDKKTCRLLDRILRTDKTKFMVHCTDDFEKAKEWLMS